MVSGMVFSSWVWLWLGAIEIIIAPLPKGRGVLSPKGEEYKAHNLPKGRELNTQAAPKGEVVSAQPAPKGEEQAHNLPQRERS
jgi:hypothetical protein